MADDQRTTLSTLAWHQRFVDLEHPNPYIAFAKSAAWGTAAFVFVSLLAILSSAAVSFVVQLFFPNANGFFFFLIEYFGYAATLVSFLNLIVVMIVESRVLIGKVWRQGSNVRDAGPDADDGGER